MLHEKFSLDGLQVLPFVDYLGIWGAFIASSDFLVSPSVGLFLEGDL